ncbi:hypothetical protein CPB85DRAFT_1251379 [Mucidula mucida]|nr:hypothetical protein CPB85DRAFT_1251379 [Mucidula mucida]
MFKCRTRGHLKGGWLEKKKKYPLTSCGALRCGGLAGVGIRGWFPEAPLGWKTGDWGESRLGRNGRKQVTGLAWRIYVWKRFVPFGWRRSWCVIAKCWPQRCRLLVLALAGGRQAGGAFVSPNAASPDVSFTPYLPLFVVARDVDDAAGPVTFLRAPDAVFRGCDIDSRFPNAIGPDTILDVVGDGGAAELAPNRAYNGVGAEGGGAAGAGLGAGSCLDFLRRNPAIAQGYTRRRRHYRTRRAQGLVVVVVVGEFAHGKGLPHWDAIVPCTMTKVVMLGDMFTLESRRTNKKRASNSGYFNSTAPLL